MGYLRRNKAYRVDYEYIKNQYSEATRLALLEQAIEFLKKDILRLEAIINKIK
jgi:hypothetical protein